MTSLEDFNLIKEVVIRIEPSSEADCEYPLLL
jgi:hypothetical protein